MRYAAVLAINAAFAAGCSTAPFERPENVELAQAAAIPRTLYIELEGEEFFGSYEEWREELTHTFERLRVCSAVMTGAPEQADLQLKVRIRFADRSSPPKIDAQGALLDFLAWSTVPLLSLWIPDIHLDPGIATDVSLVLSGKAKTPVAACEVRPPSLKTTQLERHHILSWSMAGALFVPPFVFGSPDPERIRQTIAARVRLETACGIAGVVKRAPVDGELLSGLEIRLDGGQRYLDYTASEDLMLIRLRLGDLRPVEVPHQRGSARFKVSLKKLLAGEPSPDSLLRIEAVGRKSGQRRSYSIRLDPEQAPEA